MGRSRERSMKEINISKEPNTFYSLTLPFFKLAKMHFDIVKKRDILFVNTTARERHAGNRKHSSRLSSPNILLRILVTFLQRTIYN